MIKTLTTNVVKGKFLGKDGLPSGREYTFYIDEDVLVGDVLEVFTRGRNSDVAIMALELKNTEHSYYCSDNNYYVGGAENHGRCDPVWVRSITKDDLAEIETFLSHRWQYLTSQWREFSEEVE